MLLKPSCLLLVCLFCKVCYPQAATAPSKNSSDEQTCTVSGIVIRRQDSGSLKNATVQLVNEPDWEHHIATKTTADGHFLLKNVPAGQYKLMVTQNGYVSQELGQKKPGDPGAPVALEPEKLELPAADSGQEVTPPPPKAANQSEQKTAPEQPETQPKEEGKKKRGRLEGLVVAPLPISSPAIGSGIVPVVGYIFPFSSKDKISPPSTIGAAGLITDNGSRGFGVGGQLFLKENTYEVTSGYVHGNINYNIYGTGIAANLKLPLAQTGEGYFGEFLRRLWWKFFVGPRFVTGHSFLTVRPNSASNFPIPAEVGIHSNLTAIGARLTRDTRPNHFYPAGGTFFTFTSDFFSQALGSKYTFQSYKTKLDKYWSLSKNQVLAYEGYFCATGGKPPFYGNCIYGTSNELRGYTAGQYFTRYMLATQLEYRLALPKRFGLVVFGGLGGVFPEGHELSQIVQSSHFLPGGGGGLRFELSKKYHVNLRADIAQGVDGHTFGMGIGEAF